MTDEYISLGQRVRRIIREAAEAHGVGVRAVKSPGRVRRAVVARHDAIRRLHTECGHLTCTQIAAQFGVHHGTVLYALGATRAKLAKRKNPLPVKGCPDAAEQVAAIVADVARETGVDAADIIGRARARKVARARHEAMRRIRDRFPVLTLPDIGALFGRHHTTVLDAIRKESENALP